MNKRLCFSLLTLCGLCLGFIASAQQRTVRGTVTDQANGQPVIGATVVVADSREGTTTDEQGQFSLVVPDGATALKVSYVGYETKILALGAGNNYSISLTGSAHSLDQLVVVGYGTQKRADLTGAVSTVDVEKTLGSRPITDIARGLQGSTPGLSITTPTGQIGEDPKIRLRGLSGSLNGGGAKPLILLDGVEIQSLQLVNPDDIAGISVLKDAASASIYGTRAAWGVILITTKSGQRNSGTKITYTNNFSWNRPTKTPVIADAAEGAEMAFEALHRTNPSTNVFGVVGMYFDETAIQKMREWQQQYGGQNLGPEMVMGRDFEIRDGRLFFYRPWDAGDMYMKKWTPQQTHNLTFSGGGEKTNYYLGLGYLGQDGVLKVNPDKFDRYNVTLGINSSVTNWLDVRGKVLLSNTLTTYPFIFSSATYDPWYYLLRWPKTYPYGTYEGKPFRSAVTEVQQAKTTQDKTHYSRLSLGGTLKLTQGLTVDFDYTYSNKNRHIHETGGSVSAYNFWAGGADLEYEKYTSTSYDKVRYTSDWDAINTGKVFATYSRDFGAHSLKVIGGGDLELYEDWGQYSDRRGLLDPDHGEIGLATGDQYVGGYRGHWATLGYFGRINYSYKNKFLVELNGRYDGSSRFPSNDQWAFFPSVSAGYVLTEEPFLQAARPVLSFLKLRGSWGSIGNQDVASGSNTYRFLSVMGSTSSNWIIDGNNQVTMRDPSPVSSTLTWETVTSLDFGVDARFLDGKLGATFDWYRRTTSDMISGGVTLPSSFGAGAPVRNYGELQTTGWELSLDWEHTFANELHIGVSAVLSDFQEVITKYANTTKTLPNPIPYLNNSYYEGETLGDIWGYHTDRFFSKDDFEQDSNGDLVLENGKYVLKKGVPDQSLLEGNTSWFFYGPGDIKYRDMNNDGKVDYGSNTVDDHGDLSIIGNTTPRYQYGLRLDLSWKGVDFDAFFQGVGKRDFWANGPIFIPGYRPGEAWYQHQLDYWTPDNPDAFYPRPTDASQSNNSRNFYPQTKYLLNLAYLRMKNVTIGYTLPTSLTTKAKLQQVRVYVSGENLFEFDHLDLPIDPEVDYTSAGLNDSNTFGRVYPYHRSFSVGLQVSL